LHKRFFFKFSIDNTVTWHYKHTSKRDLSELNVHQLLLFVHYSALKALGVAGRQ